MDRRQRVRRVADRRLTPAGHEAWVTAIMDAKIAAHNRAHALAQGRRICQTCGIEQPLEAFDRHRHEPEGRSRSCKACAQIRTGRHTAALRLARQRR